MPHKTDDLADASALAQLRLLESGKATSLQLTEAALARIDEHNSAVNAFCHLDRETTLSAARQADERRSRGIATGLVDGLPVAIKDVFLTRGWPIRKGSKLIPETPGATDAPAVAALRRHGMVPMGVTTTPEFGWKGVTDSLLCGPTGNPFDASKTAGGSSGGTAAAIPLGMASLGLGTDAGGSIRIPAAFSGLVGHKPTHGLAPMWPPSAFAPLAHVGPMARTVADCALLLDVIAEPDARDPTAAEPTCQFRQTIDGSLRGLRIAFSPDLGFVKVDPEVAASVRQAARAFEDLGVVVEEVDPGFDDPRYCFDILFFGGAANALRDISEADRKQMDPALIEAASWAAQKSLLDYYKAANERLALIEKMHRFHERYDLLLTPTMPIPAFEAGREVPEGWPEQRWHSWSPFTYPFNITGQPALSVPCGFTKAGLPIGLHLVGPRWRDDLVLRAGHAYQRAHPLTDRRPPLLG